MCNYFIKLCIEQNFCHGELISFKITIHNTNDTSDPTVISSEETNVSLL